MRMNPQRQAEPPPPWPTPPPPATPSWLPRAAGTDGGVAGRAAGRPGAPRVEPEGPALMARGGRHRGQETGPGRGRERGLARRARQPAAVAKLIDEPGPGRIGPARTTGP